MNHRALVAAAALSVISTSLLAQPVPPKAGHEKCYGIAQAGQNDCANLAGTHACAGHASKTNDAGDWKYVPAGTCAGLNGLTAEQAKAKATTPKKG